MNYTKSITNKKNGSLSRATGFEGFKEGRVLEKMFDYYFINRM